MISGSRTYVVPFDESHLENPRYISWLRDYEVIKTLNLLSYVDSPVTIEELRQYVQSVSQSEQDLFFALHALEGKEFIGTVRIAKIDPITQSADVGVMIGEKSFWGKGLATDILGAVCAHLFESRKMRKLTCGLMSVNPAMEKVFTRLGFKREGLFRKADYFEGEFHDHIYMGCFAEEFTLPDHAS